MTLVIHLAGKSGVRESINDPSAYWMNNVEGTKRIFNAFSKNTRILYASSSSAYEPALNPYAASKFLIDQIAPKNSVGMRFHTVYSNKPRAGMFLDKLINGTLEYVTDHSRDFIHIDDILTAIGFLIVNPLPKKPKFVDVGTGISNKLIDIFDHLNMTIKDKRMGTIYERKDNVAKIGTLSKMGWIPQTNLLDYLKEN